jgi:hypothetical protein
MNLIDSSQNSLDGGQTVQRTLPTQDNTDKQISMSEVGFEPAILVFERQKKFRALGNAATVIDLYSFYAGKILYSQKNVCPRVCFL